MLATEKNTALQALVHDASSEELIWINGFISGILSVKDGTDKAPAIAPPSAEPFSGKLTIAFGTETGNARYLANKLAAVARQRHIPVKVTALDQYKVQQLSKEEYFIVLVSTQGDGEPPVAAQAFCQHIQQTLGLDKMRYAVLALGDRSYPLFCQTGIDVDLYLERNGAQRLVPLLKCDTDFEAPAIQWFEELLSQLLGIAVAYTSKQTPVPERIGHAVYSGTVVQNIILNDQGSAKQTHHIELEAEGVAYQPGDALGVYPVQDPLLIDAILALTGADAQKQLSYKGTEATIYELLQRKLNISLLPERVIKQYAALTGQDIPGTRMALIDLLKIYPVKDTAQFEEAILLLEPLTPRLYSIASSPAQHDGELHLTVAKDTFYSGDELRYGLCSGYLGHLDPGTRLGFHIHTNNRFRLPEADRDIIMVGPGTGIAPFRAFLHEREATMAGGRNWLFFGDRHFTADFLYQVEIQSWIGTGLLTRFNAAFSRDQEEKIYVQHRMQEHGQELYAWLEQGAFLYVCGAKDPMSYDVEQALTAIVFRWGNKSIEEAEEYVRELEDSGRYLKDVY